jgi:hypothetical protein
MIYSCVGTRYDLRGCAEVIGYLGVLGHDRAVCPPTARVASSRADGSAGASQRLLRLSSWVSKRRVPNRWASELMVNVAWNRTTVDMQKPHTNSYGPLVPS